MIELWFDGSCWPRNPFGHTGAGCYVRDRHNILYEDSKYVGVGTKMSCNVGEYSGLLLGMRFLANSKFMDEHIVCRGDSRLVMKQMCGVWKSKAGMYLQYFQEAFNLKKIFKRIEFIWVPREWNQRADWLSTQCLIPYGWKPGRYD